MNTLIRSLWSYWDKPSPKARLNKVENTMEVSNRSAIIFAVKFIMIALAIFFAFFLGGLIL